MNYAISDFRCAKMCWRMGCQICNEANKRFSTGSRQVSSINLFSLDWNWISIFSSNKWMWIDFIYCRYFVLGLPTGSTPLGMYKYLIEYHQQGKISFKYVKTFNMDEYVGQCNAFRKKNLTFLHDLVIKCILYNLILIFVFFSFIDHNFPLFHLANTRFATWSSTKLSSFYVS